MRTPDVTDNLVPINGGFRLCETSTDYVDVLRKLYSWRLVKTPKDCPATHSPGYCYLGTGTNTLLKVYVAALVWVASDDEHPQGWNKNVNTGEWYDHGYYDASSDGGGETVGGQLDQRSNGNPEGSG